MRHRIAVARMVAPSPYIHENPSSEGGTTKRCRIPFRAVPSPCKMPLRVEQTIAGFSQNVLSGLTNNPGTVVKAVEFLSESGENVQYIGAGIHRAVFAYGPTGSSGTPTCVVKIAISDRIPGYATNSLQANKAEIETWRAVCHTDIGHMFVPILSADTRHYTWTVSPRARTLDGGDLQDWEAEDAANDIEDQLAKHDAFCADVHNNNVGIMMGSGYPVITNYGFGLSCGRFGIATEQKIY